MSCFEPRLRPTLVFALLALLATAPVVLADTDEETPPPPTAGVVAFDHGIEAILPGRLLALTNLEDGTLAVLVRSDDEAEGQSQVLRLDATAGSPLETLLVSDEKLESLRRAPGDGAYRLLAASKQLAAYIRHCVQEDNAPVWLAQREGRAKDGHVGL